MNKEKKELKRVSFVFNDQIIKILDELQVNRGHNTRTAVVVEAIMSYYNLINPNTNGINKI